MSTFQGQAAASLQFAAERWEGLTGRWKSNRLNPSTATDGACCRRWLVKDLVEKRLSGEDPINWPMNFTADWPAWSSASAKVFAVKPALRQRLSAAASFKTVCSSAFVTRRCSSGLYGLTAQPGAAQRRRHCLGTGYLCDVSRNCLNR